MVVHLLQFFCFLGAKFLRFIATTSHFYHFFQVITIPPHQIAIFRGLFKLVRAEEISYQASCIYLDFPLRKAWIYIELFSFFTNFVWPLIYIIMKTRCGGGGKPMMPLGEDSRVDSGEKFVEICVDKIRESNPQNYRNTESQAGMEEPDSDFDEEKEKELFT